MRWTLERVTEPEFEPVTLAEAKRALGETDAVVARDTDIEGLIASGRGWLEDYTGRAMFDQQWRLTIGSYLGSGIVPVGGYAGDYRPSATGEIMLRRSPVLSVVSVSSIDADGAETVEDDELYEVRGAGSKWPALFPLSGANWGAGELRIVFRAGYADTTSSPQQDASVIPERYKLAIKTFVKAHYDGDPDTMQRLLDAAREIVRPERCELSIA